MTSHTDQLKRRAALVSLLFNLVSALLKAVGAALTGSVALLGEALHSGIDVASSLIAMWSVRAAAQPPDDEHPYGHGKIESLTAFGEAVLLIGTVAFIAYESIHRLVTGQTEVQRLDVAALLMGMSTLGAFLTARYVGGVGKRTRSLALEANGQHLWVDFWTSACVLVAIGLAAFAKMPGIDAVLALMISVYLFHEALGMAKRSFHELIDRRMADEDMEKVREILASEPELLSYHRLRSRIVGNTHAVDLHIVVPDDWSLVRAHDLADRIEKRIEEAVPPAVVVIHVDPESCDLHGEG